MADGIYTSLSGALARVRHLDVLSNNLANTDTTGFKADRMAFRRVDPPTDAMANTFQAPGADFPPRLIPDDKRFVDTEFPATWFGAGALHETGNDLDVALSASGRVFFAVDTPLGVRYTRDGSFTTDAEGRLVTAEGHPVRAAGGGNILLHPGATQIDVDGTVYVDDIDVGALEIALVPDGAPLAKAGHALFEAGAAVGPADAADYEVRQGYLEQSNVNPVRAMTELISVHRTFEVINTTMKTYDAMDRKVINEVGKPTQS